MVSGVAEEGDEEQRPIETPDTEFLSVHWVS
jgi:hypothetical protein